MALIQYFGNPIVYKRNSMHLIFPKAHFFLIFNCEPLVFNIREIGTKSEKHKHNVDDFLPCIENIVSFLGHTKENR